MNNIKTRLLMILIICSCTCGGRTECLNNSKISVVMNFHSKACEEILDFAYEEYHNSLMQYYNYTHDGLITEILLFDTCGSDVGTSKAIFKSMVWANIDCLKPPYFLGFVGPNTSENLNVAVKMTSALKIPHVTEAESVSKYTHYLSFKDDCSIIQGTRGLLQILGWKSFTVKNNSKSIFIKNMATKFMQEAAANKLCVLPVDDKSPYIVYFGEIDDTTFADIYNSYVVIITEDEATPKLRNLNTTNYYLVIDNIRSHCGRTYVDINNIKWLTAGNKINKSMNKNEFTQKAVRVYVESLNLKCKNVNCFNNNDSEEWNNLIASVVTSYNSENKFNQKTVPFKIKGKYENIQSKGRIDISKNLVKVYWNEQLFIMNETENNEAYFLLKQFTVNNKTVGRCEKSDYADVEANKNPVDKLNSNSVIIAEMTDSEWWTMVGTVSGIGIAMFTVGFLAVYVVYTNIRGPTNTKNNGKHDFDRDSSLRRVGSDRPTIANNRNTRITTGLQRRDSRSSIRSNISEKSV